MAFTFKKVLNGIAIGKSLFDEEGSKIVPESKAASATLHPPACRPGHYLVALSALLQSWPRLRPRA